jgi:hypothetical protein
MDAAEPDSAAFAIKGTVSGVLACGVQARVVTQSICRFRSQGHG